MSELHEATRADIVDRGCCECLVGDGWHKLCQYHAGYECAAVALTAEVERLRAERDSFQRVGIEAEQRQRDAAVELSVLRQIRDDLEAMYPFNNDNACVLCHKFRGHAESCVWARAVASKAGTDGQ